MIQLTMKFLTREILSFYEQNEDNDWYLKKFFSNTKEVGIYQPFQEGVINSKRESIDKSVETVDEVNTYRINYIGCRGEIDEDSDILASGCSITFGLGVPEDGRWTNLLSKKINKSVTNLGSCGASVEYICFNIIQYCLNTKMPKEIFCFFPDFFRSIVLADKEFYKSRVNRGSMGTKDMLEAFCLSNNIKLHWTTWNTPSSYILEELGKIENFKLKNFTSFYPAGSEYSGMGGLILDTCDPDTHEHEFKDHECWANGSDYYYVDGKKTDSNSHPGIHTQEHISDFFYNLYKEKNEDN